MKFRDIARKALGGNNILGGREKIKIDDLIAKYPDCVSITGVTLVEYADVSYPAFTFAEDPTKYFAGGLALRNMVNVLIEADPTLEEVNAEFKAHPLRVKLAKVRTKSGNTFTTVTELDDDIPTTQSRDEDGSDNIRVDLDTGEVITDEPF